MSSQRQRPIAAFASVAAFIALMVICASARQRVPIKPTIPSADRYASGKVFLEHADVLHYEERRGEDAGEQYQVLNGNVQMRKNDMFMFCDSAYFYEESNSFDAFGNVRMEQGDTLFVYADELNYDGINELAVLYADPGKKVRLINRDVKLSTDVFYYDMAEEVGYYNIGGTLTDTQNKLTSIEGEYHPSTKFAYFYTDVVLESNNNKDNPLFIYTDSLIYNTGTHIAELVSPTKITNADGDIFSSSGIYNTDDGKADLYDRSFVVTRKGNTLTGDTLFYDRTKQYGEAFGNMILTDSARHSSLQGDYGYYNELIDSAFVTGRALAKEYSKGDTLYMHGDTINAYLNPVDSTKITNAFHKVRFYRSDLQGICDSMSVVERDSLMYMYRNPVIWSDKRQIFGSVIVAHFNDSTVDWARLPQAGFMAEHIAEDCYNQLSGNDMTVWFNDSTVRRLYVEGNVQLIIFPMENDSTYNKFAYVESSYMDSYFLDNAIESVHFWPETTSKITPLYLAKRKSYVLPKFKWYEELRPFTPGDVFVVPEGMVELIKEAGPIVPFTKMKDGKNSTGPNRRAPEWKSPVAPDGPDAPPIPLDESVPILDKPAIAPEQTSQPAENKASDEPKKDARARFQERRRSLSK